jgi:2-polyprenyl-3-methyl-5-hydroxy-6-metoxy-1,4-benzoquinol methylase
MKTNYLGHDYTYQKIKKMSRDPNGSKERVGWNTIQNTQENIAVFKERLQRENFLSLSKCKALELGCGTGDITLWLSQEDFDAFGIDISPTAIEWAKEKAEERKISANFTVGNVLELEEYDDSFFDLVVDGYCLHCIIGNDRRRFLESAYRVLKPGGIFIVNTMCGEITTKRLSEGFDPKTRCQLHDGIAYRYIGVAEDIVNEIRIAGFSLLQWEVKGAKDDDDQDNLLVNAIKNQEIE